jgi:hypothetical protein
MQLHGSTHRYTVSFSGNHPFIDTTLSQIVRAVAAILSPLYLAEIVN